MKKCSYCKKIKSVKQFYKRGDYKNKYKSQCKKCSSLNDYRKFLKGNTRKIYLKKCSEYAKQYRKNNPLYVKRNFGLGKYRYARARIQAMRHNCKWLLTQEQYYRLIKQKCYYCNKKLETKGIGLDKRNSRSLIYSIKNVVPCCKRCNWIKGTWFTVNQMKKIGNLIKTFK